MRTATEIQLRTLEGNRRCRQLWQEFKIAVDEANAVYVVYLTYAIYHGAMQQALGESIP